MSEPESEVTEDRLLGGRVVLRQPAGGYRAAIDPVLLAAAAPARDARYLDLGCGVGTAGICLAKRVAECRVTGLEIQPSLAVLAHENAEINGLAGRMEIQTGDLLDPPEALGEGMFDGVLTNPPYQDSRQSAPPDGAKAIANREGEAGLVEWIGFAGRMLKPKGWLAMIHRADRIDALCAALYPDFGESRLLPLWPKSGKAARRLSVLARKVRSEADNERDFVNRFQHLYTEGFTYTSDFES